MNAVCLLSGGMDSAVSCAIAKSQGYEIYPLTVGYNQRNSYELDMAKKLAIYFSDKPHKIFQIDLRQIGGSALTDQIEVPEEGGEGIPATYVPARNTIFLSIALAYAEIVDADAIFIGVNSMDYSGYPDCRPKYIEKYQEMANLATKRGIEGDPIKICAPLQNMSKKEIVEKGLELSVPFKDTWSCYRAGKTACNRCDSCRLRLEGFEAAGSKDPIEYEK